MDKNIKEIILIIFCIILAVSGILAYLFPISEKVNAIELNANIAYEHVISEISANSTMSEKLKSINAACEIYSPNSITSCVNRVKIKVFNLSVIFNETHRMD